MIQRADLQSLSPQQRAQVIYSEAQSALSNRLWRAALGDSDKSDRDTSPFSNANMSMDSLMGLLQGQSSGSVTGAACACHCACACGGKASFANAVQEARAEDHSFEADVLKKARAASAAPIAISGATTEIAANASVTLGANARYAPAFEAAAARTGIPAPALAAIVDAEAAKGNDGAWNTHSRNPRSSAAGLGQFLSGTWVDLAQTSGTWLNSVATERGWLDGRGRVNTGSRSELLALRYDPNASILGVADLAKSNLDRLEKSGVNVRHDAETLAKAAYLGHHLGLGDAKKFLSGGIEAGRARLLLSAQIGASAAEQRISSAGNATQAHREWLLGYINRKIRPDQFAA
ncbi:peptidoglycan-binding protein [Sphingomonas sp. MMS12-HWE2-04]|uniref:peptidoglycan-binding protein n=1 Tax=Sphingomonas sp. MMS12-HWE2-04 TaxID=3234199 RepID=UPI00384B81A8